MSADFAALIKAIEEIAPVDLAPLTAEVKRMADAQYSEEKGIAQVVSEGNVQVESVIHADTTGQMRVQVNPDMP